MIELQTVSDVIHVLGGDRAVSELTGRKSRAPSMWRLRNRFPAVTYTTMQNALIKSGHTASSSLWGMATIATHVNDVAKG